MLPPVSEPPAARTLGVDGGTRDESVYFEPRWMMSNAKAS